MPNDSILTQRSIVLTDDDRRIRDEDLGDFVPDRLFDAHIHLFHPGHTSERAIPWTYADLDTIRSWSRELWPGRDVHFLIQGTPCPGLDVAAHHSWVVQQAEQDPRSRINRLVTPGCDIEQIRQDVMHPQVIGLKPYRLYSVTGDIHECRIHHFLTHEQMELADELGLWITLHLSGSDGCAWDCNLKDLTEYTTKRYPRIRWILAHCARSFTWWPIRQAIERLRDLPAIWYDLSAVTDLRPILTLLRYESSERIFYGSDGVDAGFFRGKYVTLGRAWQGLDVDRLHLAFPHCQARPILAVYEQLLAFRHAAEIAELSPADLDNIFWKNAWREFGVVRTAPSRTE